MGLVVCMCRIWCVIFVMCPWRGGGVFLGLVARGRARSSGVFRTCQAYACRQVVRVAQAQVARVAQWVHVAQVVHVTQVGASSAVVQGAQVAVVRVAQSFRG